MSEQQMAQFEAQAAEIVGALKAFVKEFEGRLGEAINAQRLANVQSRDEAAKVRAVLEDLTRQARTIANAQTGALDELRQRWPLQVAENARAAGADQAKAFGEKIAEGLRLRLEELARHVERSTKRFGWLTALKWGGGVAIGVVLTIGLGVWALLPSVEGLSWPYVRAAATRLASCQIGKESHVCFQIDDKVQAAKGANGEALIVVRGM